ncbi:MAG TPA: hypothetical protein VFB21_10210 [Chthonomonadaceae bacterium]|nr:hypothetical protein [Chthonomonadaceae bacterium]
MRILRLPADYYQQFDADFSRDVPGEGYGGWKRTEIEIAAEHTAVVVLHAWDCGTREQYPGTHRACEYIPRSYHICQTVFPPLLEAVRRSPLKLFHVVSTDSYCRDHPGYQRTVRLAGPEPEPPPSIGTDPVTQRLRQFRSDHVFPGARNQADQQRLAPHLTFAPEARPLENEGIAATSHQLFALCQESQIHHLIYIGFAVNGCMWLSPGGMVDMQRRGLLCSTIRQAVTAIENRETAREERNKQNALWYIALLFGFVFDADDLIAALRETQPTGADAR